MRKHLLAIAVILTAGTGCDNVAWGGIDVHLKGPPVSETAPPEPDEAGSEEAAVTKVSGPVLLAGDRDGARASLVIVGELLANGLAPFPDPDVPTDATRLSELTAPGAEWVLFSEGTRVGRLTVDAAGPASEYCGARVRVSGVIEVVPDAAQATRLLALPAADATGQPYSAYQEYAHEYNQRVATLAIASEAIPRFGAQWPAGGVLDIRDAIQAFRPVDSQRPWIAATFANQDDLVVASPRQGAYALFVLGRPAGAEYAEAFTWFRSVESDGKGAPEYHDHLDWDGDGASEILLDVFGVNRRWFAALDRDAGEWSVVYEDSCGTGPSSAN